MGWSSIPAKMVARMTDMKVKKAENPAKVESVPNVRGREQAQDAMATMAENTMVQTPLLPFVIVLRYLAPVRQ